LAFYIGVIALNNPKGVITRRVSSWAKRRISWDSSGWSSQN